MPTGAISMILGGMLSSGQSLASSALHYYQQKKLMKKQAEYNRENAAYVMNLQDAIQRAYSKDLTGWQLMTNPTMKMEGLRAAGLNPILAYDTSTGSLASESVTPAGNVSGGSASTANMDVLGGMNSALDMRNKSIELEKKPAMIDADIGLKQSQADSLDIGREKTFADIGVVNAQEDKIREEALGIKLSNDLKAASNARDIARAKADYENDTGELEKNKALGGKPYVEHNGSIGIRAFTPYEKAIMEKIENDKYLNSRDRSMIMDALNGAQGVTSAAGSLFGKSNGVFRKATPAIHNHFH